MDRKVRASVLILLAVTLAGPAAGDMTAVLAAGAGTAAASRSLDAALWQLLVDPGNTLEDGVAPELTVDVEVHRRVLAGTIGNQALIPNKHACLKTCSEPGEQYTGHGCQSKYECRNDSPSK